MRLKLDTSHIKPIYNIGTMKLIIMTLSIKGLFVTPWLCLDKMDWRHDIQHNDIQHNDI
jgi:hypothetical protein